LHSRIDRQPGSDTHCSKPFARSMKAASVPAHHYAPIILLSPPLALTGAILTLLVTSTPGMAEYRPLTLVGVKTQPRSHRKASISASRL
jgi:hypothetical protein